MSFTRSKFEYVQRPSSHHVDCCMFMSSEIFSTVTDSDMSRCSSDGKVFRTTGPLTAKLLKVFMNWIYMTQCYMLDISIPAWHGNRLLLHGSCLPFIRSCSSRCTSEKRIQTFISACSILNQQRFGGNNWTPGRVLLLVLWSSLGRMS